MPPETARKERKIHHKRDDEVEVKSCGQSVMPASSEKPPAPVKRRKGRLSLLPTLALDILLEVFARLQPLDVLHIMWTSQRFRNLLVAPSSAFIWKAARLNVKGFPDCPPHLSEVEYARLAFNPYCYGCGKRTPNGPQWEVYARAVSRWSLTLADLFKQESSGYFVPCNFEPQVRRLLKHILNLPEKSSETWIADALRNAPGIREHAKLCREWENTVREHRQEQLANIKLKRREDIHEKLSRLGFGPALGHAAEEFANHRLVKPGVGLTERMWNSIKSDLVRWIQEHEAKRLARAALTAYKASHPGTLLPGFADFSASNDGKSILHNLGDVPVSEETFGDIGIFVDNWRRTATHQLADLMVTPTEKHDGDLRDHVVHTALSTKLGLATTLFSCAFCEFARRMRHAATLDDSEVMLWDAQGKLRYEGDAGNTLVKPIIEACSLPAETTTTFDMDALDPRLMCLNCKSGDANPTEKIAIYTWRTAIGHALICSQKETGYLWHQLSDAATETAKKAESTICGTKVVGDAAREAATPQWGCIECSVTKSSYVHSIEGIKSHFNSQHGGSEPAYYRLPRFPPGMFELTLPADQCDE
ncbi:hypothetical protein BD410DRAFT_838126 [Rickenella mellea]|uniref:F-box domain-containing protein n=1 Tax=Rickenella mellea TaxID=50990 RepID=A0A4Y7QAB5_9AGAM|nr:hypothetical protein BD410DRAFT_838126 [Rickenella mellea]